MRNSTYRLLIVLEKNINNKKVGVINEHILTSMVFGPLHFHSREDKIPWIAKMNSFDTVVLIFYFDYTKHFPTLNNHVLCELYLEFTPKMPDH